METAALNAKGNRKKSKDRKKVRERLMDCETGQQFFLRPREVTP
jgi:hypothetical protein